MLFLLIASGSGAAFSVWVTPKTIENPPDQLVQDTAVVALTPNTITVRHEAAATTPTVIPAARVPIGPAPGVAKPSPEPASTPTGVVDGEDPASPVWVVAAPVPRSPTRIVIPKIGVDARVTNVGTTESGGMEAPSDFAEVGWYMLGATPGQPGRAVLAGHVDSTSGPAVFYQLSELAAGAEITIELGGGTQSVHYVVQETAMYPDEAAPLERIFSPADHAELILITCGGKFDRALGVYEERLVVYATMATNP